MKILIISFLLNLTAIEVALLKTCRSCTSCKNSVKNCIEIECEYNCENEPLKCNLENSIINKLSSWDFRIIVGSILLVGLLFLSIFIGSKIKKRRKKKFNEVIMMYNPDDILNNHSKMEIDKHGNEICRSGEEYSTLQPNIKNRNSNTYTVATLSKNGKIEYLESLKDF